MKMRVATLTVVITVAGAVTSLAWVRPATAADPPRFVREWGQRMLTRFAGPEGVAVGPTGGIYVADSWNSRIVHMALDGSYLGAWGEPGSGAGQFGFGGPRGVAVDASGNVYAVDPGNLRVQVFTSGGAFLREWGAASGSGDAVFWGAAGYIAVRQGYAYVTGDDRVMKLTDMGAYVTEWGGEGSGNGQFLYARGIAVAASGNVYVADMENHRIQQFTSSGVFARAWGSFGEGDGHFVYPEGVSVDGAGYVYVTDSHTVHDEVPVADSNRVQKFTSTGGFVTSWGGTGTSPGQLVFPRQVAADSVTNRVYVTDFCELQGGDGGNVVHAFDLNGSFVARWYGFPDAAGFASPSGIAESADGFVYIADTGNARLQKFRRDGSFVTAWGSVGTGPGQFLSPYSVAVAADGTVFASDFAAGSIQRFSADGGYLGGWTGAAAVPSFREPRGLYIEGDYVYVTAGCACVLVFTSAGGYVRHWGDWGSGVGQLMNPAGVAVFGGVVYVADTGNGRIQRFTLDGNFLGTWGSFGTNPGMFRSPGGLAVNEAGHLFVADTGNQRVQELDAGGASVTMWGSDGTQPGQLRGPLAVAVDSRGCSYVVDTDNDRVQQFGRYTFPDVLPEHWAFVAVEACYDAGLVSGFADGTYQPTWSVTRGQMATFLARGLAGGDANVPTGPATPTFSDVPADHKFYRYIEYVAAQKVAAGFSDGTFAPRRPVTRGQMAAFIARSMEPIEERPGLTSYTPPDTAPSFPDVVPEFTYYKYIEYLEEHEVAGGFKDGLYHADYPVTRAQMAVFLAAAFGLTP